MTVAAVPLAGDDVELHVHGPALSDDEHAHRRELEQLVGELELEGRVTIGDSVPRAEIPALFASHDALVNNMRAGAPDKVVYEAAASCLPVLASNPIFDELLAPEQRFTRWDPSSLADRIRALAAMSPAERATLGARSSRASRREPLGAVVGAWHPRRGGHRRDGRRRTPHPEGRGHLRLGGAPAPAPARSPRARLGHPLPHAPRGRARRVGVRAGASRARRPARRHPSSSRRGSDRVRRGRRLPRDGFGPASCTRISSTRTSTASSPGR